MKSFKEYMTKGFAIGGIDSVQPIKSMGDTGASKPPKGKGSRSSRAVGLVAQKDVEGTPLHKHMVKKGVIKKNNKE